MDYDDIESTINKSILTNHLKWIKTISYKYNSLQIQVLNQTSSTCSFKEYNKEKEEYILTFRQDQKSNPNQTLINETDAPNLKSIISYMRTDSNERKLECIYNVKLSIEGEVNKVKSEIDFDYALVGNKYLALIRNFDDKDEKEVREIIQIQDSFDNSGFSCFDTYENIIICGNSNGQVKVIDKEKECSTRIDVHRNFISEVKFSQIRNIFLSCSHDRSIKM